MIQDSQPLWPSDRKASVLLLLQLRFSIIANISSRENSIASRRRNVIHVALLLHQPLSCKPLCLHFHRFFVFLFLYRDEFIDSAGTCQHEDSANFWSFPRCAVPFPTPLSELNVIFLFVFSQCGSSQPPAQRWIRCLFLKK